ncbi:hypothetical protein GCM10007981_05780 [Thermocladium modestius]|uniref:Zinc-ribbon domain-containing protein n=1 Tax=Thermocladium modestius TaxID=62609 RepID=A0A830GUP1_9CREN|nr:DUF2208 family protein [Thermocladium modestius]GGP19963.1 hypothetical protein GCM10007981_05780 [Thermocladium modestius]
MSMAMQSGPVKYLFWVAAPIAFAAAAAWGEVAHNSWLSIGVFVGYLVIVFGAMIAMSYRTYRSNAAEIEKYKKQSALGKLDPDEIRKAMERDSELQKEYSQMSKGMFKNMFILLALLLVIIFIYPTLLSTVVNKFISAIITDYAAGLATFYRSFLSYFFGYLVLFGVWFLVFYVLSRALKLPFAGQSANPMGNLPMIPSKGVIFYRDAFILDGSYIMRTPMAVKKVLINERRRFVEIELEQGPKDKKRNPMTMPYQRIRLYTKSPRELWNKVLSKYFQQASVETIERPQEAVVEEQARDGAELQDKSQGKNGENRYVCPYCGSPIMEGWEYCPKCGRKIPWDKLRED